MGSGRSRGESLIRGAGWVQPIFSLALKCAISNVALKKICEKSNVSTPPRGYWAKTQNHIRVGQEAEVARVVALGASNLTRGFKAVVSAARSAWGHEVQVLAALGYGRSYGAPSRVAVRTLPGILESGLWRTLESLPELPTRALVADIGNDILYGSPAELILEWVEEALSRLQRVTRDIILTDLPMASIRRLSQTRFLVFRSILFPYCRLPLGQVLEIAECVNAGLLKLSTARGVRLFRQNPAWYGLDPIHIRQLLLRSAWQEMIDARCAASESDSLLERLTIYLMPPERRWILGVEQFTPQSGVALPSGGRVWLF